MPNEFDPTSEKHFPLLIIKAVEPGCTTELQIENTLTGEVTRFTTTEDPSDDEKVFATAIQIAWEKAWLVYQFQKQDGG